MVWASPSYQKWVLLNSNGEIINEYSFETVSPCLMGKYLPFSFSDWVVPLRKYDISWGFSNGFAWVTKDGKFGLIDRRGEEKLPCVYSFEYVRGVVMGLAWVELNGKEGYIDTLGRQIIPCEYDYISDFENGIAYIVKNKKYGLIDSYGNEIVKPAYERVMYCKDSVIWVMDEAEKWGLIDMKEQKLTPSIFDSVRGFVNGRAWVNLDGKWGFLNLTDYSVSFPLINLEIIYILQDGSSWGKINNKFGLFDAVGNIIFLIDKSVETLVPTNNDKLAIIESAGEWELISTDGKVLTSKKYENIICFENALAQVQLGNMWGLIDTSGKEVLTPMYEAIYHFKNGLVQAGLDEKWDLIDEHGAVINKEKYDNILEIHNKVVIVEKNRKVGLIDRAGNEILPCIYDKYDFRTENKILFYQYIYRESRMGLFFVDSMTWIPAEYEEIAQPNDPWIMVMKNGKWGWVDHKGNIKIPCRYNAATPFNDYSNETDGYATVFQFGLQFRINKKGEMIWR